jgi:hypothetical protein
MRWYLVVSIPRSEVMAFKLGVMDAPPPKRR